MIEAFGSQEDAAGHLGVNQSTVSRWVNQTKQLPAEYVLQAEQLTGVSRHVLRPDIYPVENTHRFHGVDRFAGPVAAHGGRVLLRDNAEAKGKRSAA